jgi:hypothetical protein
MEPQPVYRNDGLVGHVLDLSQLYLWLWQPALFVVVLLVVL